MLIARETTLRQGSITNAAKPAIEDESVSMVPFKDGVLIFNGEPFASFIYFFDGRGRRMQTKELRSSGQIDLSSLPAATYHLQVLSVATGQFVTRRLVVK